MNTKSKLRVAKVTRIGELKQAYNYFLGKYQKDGSVESRELMLGAKADLARVQGEYDKVWGNL